MNVPLCFLAHDCNEGTTNYLNTSNTTGIEESKDCHFGKSTLLLGNTKIYPLSNMVIKLYFEINKTPQSNIEY